MSFLPDRLQLSMAFEAPGPLGHFTGSAGRGEGPERERAFRSRLSLSWLIWRNRIGYVQNCNSTESDKGINGLSTGNFMSLTEIAIFFTPSYLIHTFLNMDHLTFRSLQLQFQMRPAEGAAHLCNPCHSSAAGPGQRGRYTGSCQEC